MPVARHLNASDPYAVPHVFPAAQPGCLVSRLLGLLADALRRGAWQHWDCYRTSAIVAFKVRVVLLMQSQLKSALKRSSSEIDSHGPLEHNNCSTTNSHSSSSTASTKYELQPVQHRDWNASRTGVLSLIVGASLVAIDQCAPRRSKMCHLVAAIFGLVEEGRRQCLKKKDSTMHSWT